MAELATVPFVMHCARDAMAGGIAHIEEQVKAIELAVVKNPSLAWAWFDGFIEHYPSQNISMCIFCTYSVFME